MQKKIYILMGNPNADDTMSADFAHAYADAAKAAGHEVRYTNISDMAFDPILHKGYKEIQELEPDLKQFQEDMRWADHFVLVYPLWWAGMPALLKGMWDRAFLPGFAFRFHKTGFGWDKLLSGKTARVIILSNNWPVAERLLFGDFTNEIGRAILGFAGYKVRITKVGGTEHMDAATKTSWITKIQSFARDAK